MSRLLDDASSLVPLTYSYRQHSPTESDVKNLQAHRRRWPFKIVTSEVCQESEIVHPGAASARRHYQSHHGTHFSARAMAGDPAPPIAEPRTFQRQDRSISFGLRPSGRQDTIF